MHSIIIGGNYQFMLVVPGTQLAHRKDYNKDMVCYQYKPHREQLYRGPTCAAAEGEMEGYKG